jgi:GMP synthase-like glutamine amidotransferase
MQLRIKGFRCIPIRGTPFALHVLELEGGVSVALTLVEENRERLEHAQHANAPQRLDCFHRAQAENPGSRPSRPELKIGFFDMTIKKRFLTFQHMPWEGPGVHLIRSAEKRGIQLDVVEVWHEPIPDLAPYAALIVLGGEPNVDQEAQYPFLKPEKAAIRRSIEEDRPYLGFCLGHQLLADALGAKVGENFCRSIGFIKGRVTKEGQHHALFQNLPQILPLFKWHAQAIVAPVPKQIEVLVTSSDCVVEAISLTNRPHIVGLQFDNHAAARANVASWIEGDSEWLALSPEVNPSKVLADAVRLERSLGEEFEMLFNNFVGLIPCED